MIRLIAFDLDGTLTQHRSPLGEENRRVLDRLKEKYRLLMVGAGTCERIFEQMGRYPIDIIGNYGMQFARFDPLSGKPRPEWAEYEKPDREEILRRAALLREHFGLHDYVGDTVEFHPTGALTFPVLGTAAAIEDKLAYDPDRAKRRGMYPFVKELFHDYSVMIGGSSSFDIVPGRFGKNNALRRYMADNGFDETEVAYCGDDYHEGGNDHDVYASGLTFVKVDDHRRLEACLKRANLL